MKIVTQKNFSKVFVFAFLGLFSVASTFASETCYELSSNGKIWSRTPELICVAEPGHSGERSRITLEINELSRRRIVATFDLDLLVRARCVDCNSDVFGVRNPTNSIFNSLLVKFDGTRVLGSSDYTESGTVSIGENVFSYRKF